MHLIVFHPAMFLFNKNGNKEEKKCFGKEVISLVNNILTREHCLCKMDSGNI